MDAKLQIYVWELRKDSGLTLEQLSEHTGLSRATLGSYKGFQRHQHLCRHQAVTVLWCDH